MIFYRAEAPGTPDLLNTYYEAGLLLPESRVICLAGAGGKTSTLFALGEAMKAAGFSAALTTTTHMKTPEGPCIDTLEKLEKLRKAEKAGAGRLLFCAQEAETKGKVRQPDFLERLPGIFDRVLIEADGSRGLPIKFPAAHEPVIPPCCDTLLIVAGLSAIGKPLKAAAHRLPLVSSCLKKSPSAPVEPEDIARLIKEGYLNTYKDTLHCCVILNQADGPFEEEAARKIAAALPDTPLIAQSLQALISCSGSK